MIRTLLLTATLASQAAVASAETITVKIEKGGRTWTAEVDIPDTDEPEYRPIEPSVPMNRRADICVLYNDSWQEIDWRWLEDGERHWIDEPCDFFRDGWFDGYAAVFSL